MVNYEKIKKLIRQILLISKIIDGLPHRPIRSNGNKIGLHPSTSGVLWISQPNLNIFAFLIRNLAENLDAFILVHILEHLNRLIGIHLRYHISHFLGRKGIGYFMT